MQPFEDDDTLSAADDPTLPPLRRAKALMRCLTCDSVIEVGERVHVERGLGAWHEGCVAPLNLDLYRRERDAR